MKTLPALIIGLIISLSLAGQALALHNTIPMEGINKVLQMHIDRKVVNSLSDDKYFQQKRLVLPELQEKRLFDQADRFPAPDCLCHLFARII